jgi:ubiquinone/menaquinone biosynthesis C-methylase UbiE
MNTDSFYKKTIEELVSNKVLNREMTILVVCGGNTDKQVLQSLGFKNVVISNINNQMNVDEFAPFRWSLQNAEKLDFDDNSFDFCIVHCGLHKCYSPHRALLEMYRVSKKGLFLFEPHDSFFSRLAVRLNLSLEYEHHSVFYGKFSQGGAENSPIPNFNFRWTEREITKTIRSYAPYGRHTFQFKYDMRINWLQLQNRKNKLFYFIGLCSIPIIKKSFKFLFPKQSNNFSALILKPKLPEDLHPWLKWENNCITLNHDWFDKKYQINLTIRSRVC